MKSITTLTFLSLAIQWATPTWAVVETKLTASDAAANDVFGWSVATNGSTSIVGAWKNDDRGSQSGSAYLFDVTTGNELFNLSASDGSANDEFGRSVAISGNTAIIGSWWDDDAGSKSGSAYLFDITTGQELFKLSASDAAADDQFGLSVSISDNTAIVGAFGNDDGGSKSGAAYVFDVTTGNELFKLTAADAAEDDLFGVSVAVSGGTAIVGAYGDDDGGNSSGSAYLFDVSTGNQLFKLTASDAGNSATFGSAVAISGDTAIVGAELTDDAGVWSGSAYLFDVTTGNELFKLTASDAAERDRFGHSVAISNNMAIVGAPNDDDAAADSGSAYLFDMTTGNEMLKLTASDAAASDLFGISVGINGHTAIIGAHVDDDGGSSSGSAYLYTSILEPNSLLLATFAGLSVFSATLRRRRN